MPEIPIRAFFVSLVALRKVGDEYEVLLLKRAESLVGEWCQIAGGIEEGETAWQAAIRELGEETGLTPQALYSADICEQFYSAARDAITTAPVFAAFVDADAVVTLNHEHSAYRWMCFAEARERVTFGGQRRVLDWVEQEFVRRPPAEHLRIA